MTAFLIENFKLIALGLWIGAVIAISRLSGATAHAQERDAS